VVVVEQLPKGGDGIIVCRDNLTMCIYLAVLLTSDAHAQHMVVWSALVRPRLHSYLWNCHVVFVLYVFHLHNGLYYMHCVATYVYVIGHEAVRDNIVLCHVRPLYYMI
jgi:hypothetical protein